MCDLCAVFNTPNMYDEFGFPEEFTQILGPEEEAPARKAGNEETETVSEWEPHTPMRAQFPEAGSNYLGGHSDGWEYRSVFAGGKLVSTYEMIRQFLQEEGYGDVPLPENADELKLFKRPRPGQQQMFGERGYVHNPLKILFPTDPKMRNALILCVYNEQAKGHLLRFHGVSKI